MEKLARARHVVCDLKVDFEERDSQCVRLQSQLYIFLCVLRLDRK